MTDSAAEDGGPARVAADDHHAEEASAAAQDEAKELANSDESCDEGKRNPDIDVLARGIAAVMGPVMNNFDGGVEGVLKSQSILVSSIDRLTRELDKLLEDVPHPYATHHATRLSGIRKRVISLNTSLRIIQKRMDMIQRLLAGYASRAAASLNQENASQSHSTSNYVSLMELPPCEGSCHSADNHSSDELSKVQDSEVVTNYSGNLQSGGLQDDTVKERMDLKNDIVVSPNNIGREPGGTSIARDEEAGDSDAQGN